MIVADVSISCTDMRALVDLLLRVGRARDLELARRLQRVVEGEPLAVELDTEERHTVLGVLDDPPAGLAHLRGVLLRRCS